MADRKIVSAEEIKPLLEAIAKEEYNPKNLAAKIGSKDNLSDRRIQIRDFLNSLEGADPEAKEMLSSLKGRTDRNLKVAGSQYASSKNMEPTNFDDLNAGNAVKVAAKDDAAKILEQKASQVDPLEYKIQQNRGIAAPNIMDVQQVDIAGAKRQALENIKINPKAAHIPGKLPRIGGGGKLGALAALGSLGYQAFKGEPVHADTVFKAGAELINPLPFSMEEMKAETDKMGPKIALERYQAEKEKERSDREAVATPGALEFGNKLEEMQQNPEVEPNMSARKEELRRRLSGY